MSYTSQPTNSQSLNGIITLTDGVITIEDGTISGLDEIDLIDLQVSDTATIENLVVNNQIDMTSGKITNLANGTNANDAVNKSQLDLKSDTTYVDTNFLNKTTATTQNVASRLTFNNTTSGQSFPIIELTNAITGSNNGMYLQFFKNFNRLPNTEIGSIVFADKAVSSQLTKRAVQLTASIDNTSNPVLNITFDGGNFNPLTINNTQTFLRNDDFYIKNKTSTQNLLYYTLSNDFWGMSKSLNMTTNNITNVNNLTINTQIDMTSGQIINLANPVSAQDASTKYYTDNASVNTNYLKRDGSLPMLGAIDMNTTNKITNLANGSNANDAVNKSQLDLKSDTTYVDTNFLNKTTTTTQIVNSNLDMNTSNKIKNLANGTNAKDAVNKSQLDLKADTTYLDTNFLNKTTATTQIVNSNLNMNTTNKIINLADPVSAQDASTKYYTDNASVNTNYLKRDGSLPMLGAIDMNTSNKISNLANPTLAQDASTKYYTDNASVNTNYLKRDGSLPMLGAIDMNTSNKISNLANPTLAQDASTKYYTDTHSNNNNYLLKTGGTMSGAILMDGVNEIRLKNNPASGSGARIYSDGGNTYYYTRGVGIYIALNNSANPDTNDGKIFISRDTTEVRNNFSVEGARKYNMKVYTTTHTMIMNSETTGDMESIAIIKGSGLTFRLPNQNFNYWRNRWYIVKNGSTNNVTIDFNGNTYEGATGTMTLNSRRQISLYFDEDYGSNNPINRLVWNITSQSNAP
jgi:hypothetical protein